MIEASPARAAGSSDPDRFFCPCGRILAWTVAEASARNVRITLRCPNCGERYHVYARDCVFVFGFRCTGWDESDINREFIGRVMPLLRALELGGPRLRWLPPRIRPWALRRWPERESVVHLTQEA